MKISQQIYFMIQKYEAITGNFPEEITLNQHVYDLLVQEENPQLITYANKQQDTLWGIPLRVIADSDAGYVCIGPGMGRVVYDEC